MSTKPTTASGQAMLLADLIRVSRLAMENKNDGSPIDERGIGGVLEAADQLAFDLIDQIERMEREGKE